MNMNYFTNGAPYEILLVSCRVLSCRAAEPLQQMSASFGGPPPSGEVEPVIEPRGYR